jgi:hypothetical protein
MLHSRKIPEPWNSFLGELDQQTAAETRLDCMGGFVVTLLYGFWRETADLDVLLIAPREQSTPLLELGRQGGKLHKRYRVYLDYVGIAKVPEEYEERLTEMFPGAYKHLRLCALDPYDLTLSKLERNIQPTRSRRCKASGPFCSIGPRSPQGTLWKRTALATRESRTGGSNTEALDENDRR